MANELITEKRKPAFTGEHIAAILLIATYFVMAIVFSTAVPIYEAPDEPGHFELIAHLVNTKSLPVQSVTERNYAHHPPLYYLLAALPARLSDINDNRTMPQLKPDFVWPGQGSPAVAFHHTAETFPYNGRVLAFHLSRGISLLSGVLTVLLTLLIGWLLFPNRKEIGLAATALVAFNPQFLFVTSTVNNDSLLVAASTGTVWQLLRTLNLPDHLREWAFLGIWAAVAILSKSPGLVVVGLIAFYWFTTMRQATISSFFKSGATLTIAFMLLSGWWFIRNQQLYGDPFGWQVYREAWAVNLRTTPVTVNELASLLMTQFKSTWGVFGWMNIYFPNWVYFAIGTGLVIAAVGWTIVLGTGKFNSLNTTQKRAFVIFVVYVLFQEAFIIYQNTIHNSTLAQGRFMLPVIAPLMLMVTFGILSLSLGRFRRGTPVLLVIVPFALSIYALLGVIVPAYQIVPQPKLALLTLQQRTAYTFQDTFALRGYRWTAEENDDTIRLVVRLYWQAIAEPDFNYSVFVHAVDIDGQNLSQHDQAPGATYDYLPVVWKIEDIVFDTWTVDVPLQKWREGISLRIGVYNWISGERLLERSGNDYIVLQVDSR
jgi:4-amino-4-deoxy-L-arabinose transferase-like glycosyltransferase